MAHDLGLRRRTRDAAGGSRGCIHPRRRGLSQVEKFRNETPAQPGLHRGQAKKNREPFFYRDVKHLLRMAPELRLEEILFQHQLTWATSFPRLQESRAEPPLTFAETLFQHHWTTSLLEVDVKQDTRLAPSLRFAETLFQHHWTVATSWPSKHADKIAPPLRFDDTLDQQNCNTPSTSVRSVASLEWALTLKLSAQAMTRPKNFMKCSKV